MTSRERMVAASRNRFDDPAVAHIQKDLTERLLRRMMASTQPRLVSGAHSECIDPTWRWHTWLQNQ
ncbi:MAG: hypothetical protein HN742_17925 [Lentisphaerae bacterium]|nr:hypothetical protein [Lentisphaerota bacterium]MBT4815648.1 hypothetical protein [Lentisphaerota bacterium]MBT5613034.1 hypothetical protein [Lentisphaerota bacterium]MBT7056720.1 hypothetical protein [Lentisphaerota bacterium]MBT7843762.1 hypothetical protein [Lentisphaerota bacterium]